MIQAVAAALAFVTIDPPGHGRAFAVWTNLRYTKFITSGDAIGCGTVTIAGCPAAVYVRFSDRPDVRYPAVVWQPFGMAKGPDTVQVITVERGELPIVPLASNAQIGADVSLGACDSHQSGYIDGVGANGATLRTTLAPSRADSGCPILTGAGAAGVLVNGSELTRIPGPAPLQGALGIISTVSALAEARVREAQRQLTTGTYTSEIPNLDGDFVTAATRLCAKADSGDASAVYGCAQAYLHGYGAPRDTDRALPYLERAAADGTRNAAALLTSARAAAERARTAFASVSIGAQRGEAAAMEQLGEDYISGTGTTQDPAIAAFWLQKAVAAGNAAARQELANLTYSGSGVIADTSAGYRIAHNDTMPASPVAANRPDDLVREAKALADYGNVADAAPKYVAAAAAKNPQIEYEAAVFFDTLGKKATIDADERFAELMSDAAQKRYWRAEWYLLRHYPPHSPNALVFFARPAGLFEPNPSQAVDDAVAPANAHDGDAEEDLAITYLHGLFAAQDCDKGIFWGTRAVHDRGSTAIWSVGIELGGANEEPLGPGNGECLPASGGLALLTEIAGLPGAVPAQWRLATLYENGWLVPKDMNAAIHWYRIAAHNFDTRSKQWLTAHGLAP